MKLCAATVGLLLAMALAVSAAELPKVTLQAQQMPIKDAMAQVSKQVNMQIICDTGVTAQITGTFSAMDLDTFMNTVIQDGKLKWQKVYVKVDPAKKLTLEQIKKQIAALDTVGDTPLAVVDPATGQQTVYMKQAAATAKVTPESLGLTPAIIVTSVKPAQAAAAASTSPEPEGQPGAPNQVKLDPKVAEELLRLQTERIGMMNGLPPNQRAQYVQQEMLNEMNMDPNTRAAVMKAQVDALRSMPREMRTEYYQSMREVVTELRKMGVSGRTVGALTTGSTGTSNRTRTNNTRTNTTRGK